MELTIEELRVIIGWYRTHDYEGYSDNDDTYLADKIKNFIEY